MRTVLSNGHVFVTYQNAPTDEVYGWNETAEGQIIPKTSGWFRTEDPAKATRLAELNVQLGWEQRT